MKRLFLLAGIVAGFLGPIGVGAQESPTAKDLNVAAADGSLGEEKYQSICRNCHGRTGKGLASFPKLAGKDADYLVSRLLAYRAGDKIGPNSPLMWPLAADLTDEDIANLTAYITTEFKK
jgi:cytochrome c553